MRGDLGRHQQIWNGLVYVCGALPSNRIELCPMEKSAIVAADKIVKKYLASVKRLKHNGGTMTVSEAGRKGGAAKVVKGPASLSPERRQEIAKKAAAARWKKEDAK